MVTERNKFGVRGSSGQSLVEFAISLLTFLVLIFAVMDFSYLFLVKLTLQNAVRQAGRYAITGQSMSGQSRYNSILLTAEQHSFGLANSSNTTICSGATGCGSGGGPLDSVTITITYPYPFITPLLGAVFKSGTYSIKVTDTYKNEPFPQAKAREEKAMKGLLKGYISDESGQSLIELALAATLLLTLVFGAVDFGRAIYYVQVIKNLTSEGSSLASRGTTSALTATTVISDAASNLSLTSSGCVFVTKVLNNGGATSPYQVTEQASQGSCGGLTSKIGCFPPPSTCGKATLPTEAAAALQSGQSLAITEIYYSFSPVTPIGGLLKNVNALPSQLYDAAYY